MTMKMLRINFGDNDFWACFEAVANEIVATTSFDDVRYIFKNYESGADCFAEIIAKSAYHFYEAKRLFRDVHSTVRYLLDMDDYDHLEKYFIENTSVELVDDFLEHDWNVETVYIDFAARKVFLK